MKGRFFLPAFVLTMISITMAPAVAGSDVAERNPVNYTLSGIVFTGGEQNQAGQMLIGTGEGTAVLTGHGLLAGTGSFTIQYRWSRQQNKGTSHGPLEIEPTNYPNSGWTGTFNTKYADMLLFELPPFGTFAIYDSTTESVLNGYWVFEGMTLRASDTVTFGDPDHIGEGEILVPASASLP